MRDRTAPRRTLHAGFLTRSTWSSGTIGMQLVLSGWRCGARGPSDWSLREKLDGSCFTPLMSSQCPDWTPWYLSFLVDLSPCWYTSTPQRLHFLITFLMTFAWISSCTLNYNHKTIIISECGRKWDRGWPFGSGLARPRPKRGEGQAQPKRTRRGAICRNRHAFFRESQQANKTHDTTIKTAV